MHTYTRNLKSGFAALVICAAAVAAGSANAITSDAPRITIEADALLTERGVERTYDKITHRASTVCGVSDVQPIRGKIAAKECVAQLVEEWVVNIDNASLTALHEERTEKTA